MVTVAELAAKLDVKDGGSAKRLSKFNLSLTDIKSGLELAAGAARIAAKAIAAFTTEIANQGDQIAKTAKNLGIGVQAVQELDFAAKLAGVGINEVRTAIQRMQKGLNDARRTGTGPFADSLEQLGVRLEDFDGLKPDEIFEKLAGALSGLEDATTKAALAQDFFGRGGKTLLPLLNEGAAGIRTMRDRFQELGGGFTDDGAAAAEVFNDTMLEMNTVIDSIKIALGTELLPTMTEIIESIRDWVAANRDILRQRLTQFIREAIKAAKRLGPAIFALVDAIEVLLPLMLDLIGDTAQLIRDWDDLTRLINEDFGPAIEAVTAPVQLLIDVFEVLDFVLGGVADAIDFVLDKLGLAEGTIRDFVDGALPILAFAAADEPPPVQRGTPALTAPQVPSSGRPTGVTLATASSSQLKEAIANRSNTEAAREAAREFLPVAEAREGAQRVATRAQLANLGTSGAALAKRIGGAFGGVGQDIVGGITGAAKRAAPSRRKRGRGKSGRAASDLNERDREFEELLTADSLRKRVAEGQVTPTILVTVTNFNITQDIDAPVNITGLSSSTAQEVVAIVQREFDEMLEGAVKRGVQDVESKVAR